MPGLPSGTVILPRDDKVPLASLVARFRDIYAALLERAAHFARQQDRAGSARIGRLIFTLQGWIGSWWNGHLFRVELRLKKEPPFDPPFVDQPARLNNFCTWWIIGAPQQDALVKYLDWLAGKIRAGNFDTAGELPSFEEVAVQLEIYSPAARPARNSFGLSARLGVGAVKKAERWYAFFPFCKRTPKQGADNVVFYRMDALRKNSYIPSASYNKSFVAPQLTVDKALLSVHNGDEREGINLEAFKAWGRTWWMRLFAAHAEKAYLALWYCLTEAQRGEAIDFFVHCGLRLSSEREQALVPIENSPLAQELRDPQAARALAARRSLRGANSPCIAVLAAFEQGAVIKTGNEGYDRWPDMPEFLQSSAHSLGSSVLHNYSHRQRAIYQI